jgi:hypothetical protein
MKILEHLIASLRSASKYNPDVQVAPTCVLWPDQERQWEAVIPTLRKELPELYSLGSYSPEDNRGPAIWLRCVLGNVIDGHPPIAGHPPIIYLPGVGRPQLRAVEECKDELKPLAELQYRGVFWSQMNAKDWTILAFLVSDQGGLSLEVAKDQQSKNAMQLALGKLLTEDIDLLKGKFLDRDYFNTLLTGGDPVKELLQWINDPDGFKKERDENAWAAFLSVTQSKFAFNPEAEGVLAAASKCAEGQGPWKPVWDRFSESPPLYANVPNQIRKCNLPEDLSFFLGGGEADFLGWPQWHEEQEKELLKDFKGIGSLSVADATKKLNELEAKHGYRRNSVWAELEMIPCAMMLKPLVEVAKLSAQSIAVGTLDDLVTAYTSQGWKVDHAVLEATAFAEDEDMLEGLSAVLKVIYQPWLEDGARHLQTVCQKDGYGLTPQELLKVPNYKDGDCVFFVDGLRYDCGQRLNTLLKDFCENVDASPKWMALPSVTATGKAAVSPVRDQITGKQGIYDFEPIAKESGSSLKGGQVLKKLLSASGWTVLAKNQKGDGHGKAWTEFGNLDHEGHDRGWKLAHHVDSLLEEVAGRIKSLLDAGWKRIHVVTDHGWLYLPGDLPKMDLPKALTESKWARCSALKEGAQSDELTYPWSWCEDQFFALANGISCFKKGEAYTHGGLSLQECLTLELWITQNGASTTSTIDEMDVIWRGMRCKVSAEGAQPGSKVDVRLNAGDPKTSVVASLKTIKEGGLTSVVMKDENSLGQTAFVVVLSESGELLAQEKTVIGGDE